MARKIQAGAIVTVHEITEEEIEMGFPLQGGAAIPVYVTNQEDSAGHRVVILASPVHYTVTEFENGLGSVSLSNLGVPSGVMYVLCGIHAYIASPGTGSDFYIAVVFPDNTQHIVASNGLSSFDEANVTTGIGFIPAYDSGNIRIAVFGDEGGAWTAVLQISVIGYVT